MAGKTYTVTLQMPDGSRKFFRGKTKREAEAKRDEAKLKVGMGVNISDKTTVAELAETWFKLYKQDNADLHKRTKETTRNVLDRYLIPVIGGMPVVDVKPLHIQQLMAGVSGYSKSTQKKVLQAARSIFDMAVENDLISKTPISKQTKAGGADPQEKEPLTKVQSAALLSAVEGTRAYPLVLLLLRSGLRIGEALGLMWKDIDFKEGRLTVSRSIVYPEENRFGEVNEEMKTANAHRTVPLPWDVVDVLRDERSHSNSVWVFSMQNGNYLSYSSFRALWRIVEFRSQKKSKVNGREIVQRTLDFDVHPHLLRHTCITNWFEQGLDLKEVQYLAGHATANITLQIYTHYQQRERMNKTAQKIQSKAV